MNLANAREVEICSGQVEPEAARRRRIGGGAVDLRVLMGEMNIVESGLAAGDVQIGVELLDRLPIRRGILRVNVPLRLRICTRSGRSGEITSAVPETGAVEARERGGRGNVDVVQVHVRGERGRLR